MDRHELLRYVLDQIDVPVLATDAEGRVAYANHAFSAHHDLPAPGVPFSEWRADYRFLRADGVTPLDPDQIPLAAALRGEQVHDQRYAVVDKHGSVRFRRANGQALRDADGNIVGAVLAISDVTGQQRVEHTLRRHALVDPLTGLTSRPLLVDRLGRALARCAVTGDSLGVVFVDLLDLRAVNDAFGHAVGDDVLVELAARLRRLADPNDTIARTGGDDFVIMRESLGGEGDLAALADVVLTTLSEAVHVGGTIVHPVVVVHRAVLGGQGGVPVRAGDDLDGLLRDMACRSLRADDRRSSASSVLRDRQTRRGQLERAVADALSEQRLQAWYQPIVNARTHQILGVEALVRCVDPDLGLLSPAELIPVADQMGLLGELDEWMMRTAADQVVEWSTLPLAGDLRLYCNASAALLTRPNVMDVVADVVTRTGLPPQRLHLELTEAMLSLAEAEVRDTIDALVRHGVAVGLDDFGTGWSSLSRLRSLPVRFVKLDRSFVADVLGEDRGPSVIRAMVDLAHALSMTVTAEGVEDVAVARLLAELGCDQLQGYLFSPPLPKPELEDLLIRRPVTTAPTTS